MQLEKYISELLYRYDLVIVPGFGGIIGRKKLGSFNKENFIFTPPHKELSFNELLQKNDGLLASYIAETEGISYEKALEWINKKVHEWKERLQSERRLKINQIGIFSLTSNNKLFFLSLTTKNYCTDAYGLTSFIYKPEITNKTYATEPPVIPTKQTKEIIPEKPVYTSRKSAKSNSELWKYAAIFLIGLGIMGGGAKWLGQKTEKNQETYQKASFVLPNDFPTIVIDKKSHLKPSKTIDTDKTADQPAYFIISGAFRNIHNAEKKKKDLIRQGFKADIIGKNNRGLYLVAYEGFSAREQAIEKLSGIKKMQPGAWIFHKR